MPSIIEDDPDLLIVQGSINDDPYTPSEIGDAASALFAELNSARPGKPTVATGILSARSTTSQAGDVARNAAIQAAAESAGIPFIDTANWVYGTGRVGGTTGDGNADIYVHVDGVHPTRAGSTMYAHRLAGAIRSALPSLFT